MLAQNTWREVEVSLVAALSPQCVGRNPGEEFDLEAEVMRKNYRFLNQRNKSKVLLRKIHLLAVNRKSGIKRNGRQVTGRGRGGRGGGGQSREEGRECRRKSMKRDFKRRNMTGATN